MKRWECLDGLRGLLAVYVLLGHVVAFAWLPDRVQSLASHGGAAVDLFFVLSGLVIARALERTGKCANRFLAARAARLMPVFLPVFVLAVAIQSWPCGLGSMPWAGSNVVAQSICVTAWPPHWRAEILAHLTMTHGLFPSALLPDVWISFLGATWSLSTEWQFYLLALFIYTADRRRLVRVLLVMAAAGVAWRLGAPEMWQFSRAFLPAKAHFFALGVASVAVMRGEPRALRRYGVVLAAGLAICATQAPMGRLLPPLAWTVCLAIQMKPEVRGLRQASRVLRSPMAQYLGVISYCVYLVNEPILKLMSGVLSRLAGADATVFTSLWVPLAILLPIGVAGWLHRWLEVPALKWGRSLAEGRREAPGTAD